MKLSGVSSTHSTGHDVFIVGRDSGLFLNPLVHKSKGTFWKEFKELGTLGEGCLGVVKKCERRSTKEYIAVKQIRTRDEEKIVGVV